MGCSDTADSVIEPMRELITGVMGCHVVETVMVAMHPTRRVGLHEITTPGGAA
jgi:hypothetical protein